jgi:hypothetical protein
MTIAEQGDTRVMEQGSSKYISAPATTLLLLLPLLTPCCHHHCLCLYRGSTSVDVCKLRGSDVAGTVVDFVFVLFLFLFLFLFLLLHANGFMVSHLFPVTDISVMASSVTMAILLDPVIPPVETKMVPTTRTMATMNEMHHRAPSTLPSDPHPREGKGKGNEGKDGSHHHGRQW